MCVRYVIRERERANSHGARRFFVRVYNYGCNRRLIPPAGKATQATDVVEQPQDEAPHSLRGALPHLCHIPHLVQRFLVYEVTACER